MSDKWTGKQKGDSEFLPKAEPSAPAPKPGQPAKRTLTDDWVNDYRPLLDGPGRRHNPLYDLDYRPRARPRMETATEIREKERDWERRRGRVYEDMRAQIDIEIARRYELTLLSQLAIHTHTKVIGQRLIAYRGDVEAWRIMIPSEHQTRLAELFDKCALVPGYAHWFAESEPERVKQTLDASREIAGALRYDADYWRKSHADVYDLAAWIAQGIVSTEPTRIKVETVRDNLGGILNTGAIVS